MKEQFFDCSSGIEDTRDLEPEEIEMIIEVNNSHVLASVSNLLEETDLVAIRCMKGGVEFSQEWKEWTDHLRAVVRGNENLNTDLKPVSYPPGS